MGFFLYSFCIHELALVLMGEEGKSENETVEGPFTLPLFTLMVTNMWIIIM